MFTLTAKRPLGLLFIAVTASATQAEVRPSNSDSADILARSSQWMDAMDRQDRGTLERVIGDSFQLHLLYGNDSDVTPRLKWIDNAVERRWRHNGYDNVNIVTRGDHAVMSSTQNFAPPAGGLLKPAVNTSGAVVDIWERQDGEWKVVGRYAGRWTFFEWLDRLLGFVAGALLFGFVGWLLGRRTKKQLG